METDLAVNAVMENDGQRHNHLTLNGTNNNDAVSELEPFHKVSNVPLDLSKSIKQAACLAPDSSDSEGPLPEIDIGDSSDESSVDD